MNFSSSLIEKAVESFSTLPGIGKKTALRMVLHLIKQDPEHVQKFAHNLVNLRMNIKACQVCHNLSDADLCQICLDNSRNKMIICLVESIRDVMAIEETGQFSGVYHVIGGILSPIDGVGPEQLNIDSLLERVQQNHVKEVIMAINPTIEGETTIFYLSKRLQKYGIKVSTLARGVAFGSELEYADEITLARSIQSRMPYNAVE